ncbi:hypothetical protein GCM10010992_20240 [Cloacibacterium rupense]|uniref:Uncharacterized protein n=1 Tax=Cloacibacterium rupense TaxID=517423 RepID=A0ABQ2NJT4_9FLAO|nr:hypothetical protein [Cloacibacterium rupense]GGP05158.1 hypothetical protein GCM10010992_20240 [Cloacibacterium rupense]
MKTKIIGLLSAIVLALSGYLLYDSLNTEMSEAEIQTQFADLKADYQYIKEDLEFAVKDLNFNSKEIISQKQKIEKLVSKNNLTQEELIEAKKIMSTLSKTILKNFKEKVIVLEDEKLKLLNEKDKIVIEVTKLKDQVEDLDHRIINEKKISEKKDQLITYASKLTLSNFKLNSFKVRSSGKEVQTDKASRIDRIKVSFDINENILAPSGAKNLYMVIKKPTGETVTFTNKPSGIFMLGNKKVVYSDKIDFNYEKGKEQSLEFVWDNEEFSRGDYMMEVYEKTPTGIVMIGKVTKTLE